MDSWCKKLRLNGKTIAGGAARNVRIARAGGMDSIIADAVRYALDRANEAVQGTKRAKVTPFKVA